jgi:hypothetical protein
MGGGEERKMIGGSAIAGHVKDGGKGLKQKLFKQSAIKKIFCQKSSPTNEAQSI